MPLRLQCCGIVTESSVARNDYGSPGAFVFVLGHLRGLAERLTSSVPEAFAP